MWRKGRRGQQSLGGQHGQSNFELAANFGYDSRGSADPRESLRKRRISKLALTTHTVRVPPGNRALSAKYWKRQIGFVYRFSYF